MNVCVGKEADARILEIDSWWRENRPSAPDLFLDELRAGLDQLAKTPFIGVRFRSRSRPLVRRLLLSRTQVHVYYEVHEGLGEVHVLSVWGAVRGRSPRLKGL